MSTGYAASLTMFMAIPKKDSINSIEKLVIAQKSGNMKVIAEKGSLYMDIIKVRFKPLFLLMTFFYYFSNNNQSFKELKNRCL
jgi:hypothetical protein